MSGGPARTRRLRPLLPWRAAAPPKVIQDLILAVGIHRVEEALMVIGDQLPLRGEALQRFLLENAFVPVQIIEHAALKDEESSAGPRVGSRLLDKVLHLVGLVNV